MKSEKPLQCVSVTVAVEAEEAVAELMERRFQQVPSIWSNAELQVAVVSVYSNLPSLKLRALKTQLRAEVKSLGEFDLKVGDVRVAVRKIQPRDWAESWKRHFKPMEFGRALLVKPTWSRKRPVSGQEVVLLDPGLSFGTGQHATTRFCLESLVSVRRPGVVQSFCDMGTGSGILAIAAAKLGYEPVEAFDFDPDCVRIANENAQLNGVDEKWTVVEADLTKLPKKSRRVFDVVCANLIYDLLLSEQARVLARVKPGGHLVLAGILSTQFEAVLKAYRGAGLQLVADRTEREWRSGLFLNPINARSK